MQVYGPYTRPNGRRLVIVVDKNGKRRTVSYPKWLLEQQLKRKLDPDKETVDHIDSNLHNNELSNLRIMPRDEHSKEDTRRVKWIDFSCPWCDKTFSRSPRLVRDKAKKNRSGPFCSRNCAGKYSRMLQLKLIDKLAPQPYIVSEYFKKKNVTASVDEDDSDDIFIEDLLALASTDFVYHETRREHLPSIKEEGLLTTSYGQSLINKLEGSVYSPEEFKEMIYSDFSSRDEDIPEQELQHKVAERFNNQVPREDTIPRTYIMEAEPASFKYGEVLLRFSKDVAGTIKNADNPYILREIPPEAIEVKMNGSWYPLIS